MKERKKLDGRKPNKLVQGMGTTMRQMLPLSLSLLYSFFLLSQLLLSIPFSSIFRLYCSPSLFPLSICLLLFQKLEMERKKSFKCKENKILNRQVTREGEENVNIDSSLSLLPLSLSLLPFF